MTNEAHEATPEKPAVEVSLKSYSGKPETEDGYDLVVRSHASTADVDRTVAQAVRARILTRLGIVYMGIEEDKLQHLLAASLEVYKDEARARGIEVVDGLDI